MPALTGDNGIALGAYSGKSNIVKTNYCPPRANDKNGEVQETVDF